MSELKSQPQRVRFILSDAGVLTEEMMADLLKVTPRTIINWIERDRLPGHIIRGHSLTSVAALIAWAEKKA